MRTPRPVRDDQRQRLPSGGCGEQLAEPASSYPELSLPFVGRVLVDQRGAGAAVAHAVHQLAQARARVGVEGVPGMT
jgi:hypothetical protein